VRASREVRNCTIPARTPTEISALLADSTIATPPATTGGRTLPAGVPASPKDAAAMEAVIRQWLACQNAGEPLRAWALFSDGYLHRLLARQGTTSDEDLAALATPSPSRSEPAMLQSITGERQLPDGRLGALVTISYPSVPMPKTFFFSFTQGSDRLLIDGILGEISFSVP
jgi:hypothetical protein